MVVGVAVAAIGLLGGDEVNAVAVVAGVIAVVAGVVLRLVSPWRQSTVGHAGTAAGGGSGRTVMAGAGGVPSPLAGPGRFLGRKVDATYSADEIVARGVSVAGRLRSAAMTGRTAGQVAPHLPPEQASDPIVHIEFEYPGSAEITLIKEALFRVPAGVVHRLTPGAPLPVRVIAEDPEIAAIDWSAF